MSYKHPSLPQLHLPIQWIAYAWAFPCTLIGLIVAYIPGVGQRTRKIHHGTLVVYGPGIAKLLGKCPMEGGAWALTLGHSILACDEQAFRLTFDHEYVHVRQYEWLGIFFLPAYFLESIWQWFRGHHPYIDNRFEVQARRYS